MRTPLPLPFAPILAAALVLTACNAASPPSHPPKASTITTTFTYEDSVEFQQAGTLEGRVVLEGTPPAARPVSMAADPNCHAEAGDDDVVVEPGGALPGVLVFIEGPGLAGKFQVPREPVVLDQKGCRYHPRALGIMVGQTLEIVNSDDTLHNVHALPDASKQWHLGMPSRGMRVTKTFPAAERMVAIKCDVHPWMRAQIAVLDHPFFTTTGEGGTFTLSGIPQGDYELHAYHARMPEVTRNVHVTARAAEKVEVPMLSVP